MGTKKHCRTVTGQTFVNMATVFASNPSATNFSKLTRCMYAHQQVFNMKEEDVIKAMTNKKTEDIVNVFADMMEAGIEETNQAVRDGRARIIDEAYFHAPSVKKLDEEQAVERSQ